MIKLVTNMKGKSKKTVTFFDIFSYPFSKTLGLDPELSEPEPDRVTSPATSK
jgi:hypothetical protein